MTDAESRGTRLQKLIADAGLASRRAAEKLITEGRVSVNGETVRELGTRADPRRDEIHVNGEILPSADKMQRIVILMNKPRETLCTASDPQGRKTVFDLLPKELPRLFTIGRLDYHSEGALLFTNDGDLAQRLAHPKEHFPKVYEVKIQGELSEESLQKWRNGMRLDGRATQPALVKQMESAGPNTWYEITLFEGRNRQIHRMMDSMRHRVNRLRRVAIGPLLLGPMPSEQWRPLTLEEIQSLEDFIPGVSEVPSRTPRKISADRPDPRGTQKRERRGRPERGRGAAGSSETKRGRGRSTGRKKPPGKR
jgi:23S rRNA pseudouridine2605 synthase